jgi:hypothetical protein
MLNILIFSWVRLPCHEEFAGDLRIQNASLRFLRIFKYCVPVLEPVYQIQIPGIRIGTGIAQGRKYRVAVSVPVSALGRKYHVTVLVPVS